VPFITTRLSTGLGDYCFALAYGENVIIIPHLIERKSAVDFAASMRDGRLEEQLIAMKKLENWVNRKFEGLETSISYIFEGKFESVLVQKDGIKYVGKAQYPTLETCVKQKKKWKENVKTIETDDMLGTIRYLAKLYENYRSKEKELYRKISSFREIQKLDYFKVFKEKNKKKELEKELELEEKMKIDFVLDLGKENSDGRLKRLVETKNIDQSIVDAILQSVQGDSEKAAEKIEEMGF